MAKKNRDNVIKFKRRRRRKKQATVSGADASVVGSRNRANTLSIVWIFATLALFAYWTLNQSRNSTQVGPLNGSALETFRKSDAQKIAGPARIVDGDTIRIGRKSIRIDGYDAPEKDRKCGRVDVYKKASAELAKLISSRRVTCQLYATDKYGRDIGLCQAGGQDLAAGMVESGWARDWPKYSHGAYADEERRARRAKRGIWGLDCPANLWGHRLYN